jgi:catechol 2,3-dioxygenase-like lactoylglutathione lyase family enzyme
LARSAASAPQVSLTTSELGVISVDTAVILASERLRAVIGNLHGIVIDCPDPDSLATFYQELLGMQRVQDDEDWIVIGDTPDRPGIAFARVPNYRPPTWPTGERPQYRHFDVRVADLDAAEQAALRLGATPLSREGLTSRIMADPVGHPFCLVKLPTAAESA